MSFFISEALAQPAAAQATGPNGALFQILFLGGLFALFYFMAIRPQRKRQKEVGDMIAALAKGDEVVTTSGMLGKVVKVEDDYVTLKVTDTVELRFQKHAVNAVLPKGTLKSI